MTTLGGEPCETQGCTKNLGHLSEHRVPRSLPRMRTLAQALGTVNTCPARLERKDQSGELVRSKCRKPAGHSSNHHDGGRTWA